jgi:addiction module HigA family antidote
MVRIPKFREPSHPGKMLMEEFLAPMSITQRELSEAIHVPYQRINEIVNGRRGITPRTALRLAKFFNMSEDFWMNIQLRWDLYHAKISEENELRMIKPYTSSEKTAHI